MFAQVAESVDALVSNTSGAIRAGSTPALGTQTTAEMTKVISAVVVWRFGDLKI